MNDLRELLAALAHEQWAGWMKYLFDKAIEDGDGRIVLPALLVSRWKRQMNTAYIDLPEGEKDSDRAEADKLLNLLHSNAGPNLRG